MCVRERRLWPKRGSPIVDRLEADEKREFGASAEVINALYAHSRLPHAPSILIPESVDGSCAHRIVKQVIDKILRYIVLSKRCHDIDSYRMHLELQIHTLRPPKKKVKSLLLSMAMCQQRRIVSPLGWRGLPVLEDDWIMG